jgi:mono/diheme cytochrome c family protein
MPAGARSRRLWAGAVLVLAAAGWGCRGAAATRAGAAQGASDPVLAASRTSPPDASVTPASGPSWLQHLNLPIDQTRMGQMGGTGEATPSERREPELAAPGSERAPGGMGGMMGRGGMGGMMGRFLGRYRVDRQAAMALMGEPFELAGADLYRLDCRSCHGPDGQGAPPEIKSLLDPVRGATASAIETRMKKAGHPIPAAMASRLAAEGEAAIRKRLAQGGQKMPAFPYLRGDEVDALLAHLRHLAGIGGPAAEPRLVSETAARVGERLVKGTCQICHGAVGPGARAAMMEGTIPSLASFPAQESLGAVVQQVEYGSSPMMGMMGGPRMPALPYITPEETAAAYFYLEAYPPQP